MPVHSPDVLRLRALVADLVKVVKNTAWDSEHDDCVECGNLRPELTEDRNHPDFGHQPWCQLGDALARAEREGIE